MNGLELARHFYFECVRPIIGAQMPELLTAHAAGLIGYGSDVLGNDDESSRDHEWGPRLLIFLDAVNLARYAKELNEILATSLPLTFMGFPTRFQRDVWGSLVMAPSGTGKPHISITTVQKFLEGTIGYSGAPTTEQEWLLIPEQRLLEFTSGKIFYDGIGHVTALREQLAYFPEPIWKYRLSYTLESLGWELGLISLCAKRGDYLSMHLNVAVTVKRIMQLTFLANRRYCPSYAKWLHREFVKLPLVADEIEGLLKEAFAAKDEAHMMSNIEKSLAILHAQIRTLRGLQDLPSEMPRVENRGIITLDTQEIARLVLRSIPGPLAELSIRGAPYGAADQWIAHEDMLLSPTLMKTFANVYNAERTDSSRHDAIL
jgi:hypothetical protein